MFGETTFQNFINKMFYYLYTIIHSTFNAKSKDPVVRLETSPN